MTIWYGAPCFGGRREVIVVEVEKESDSSIWVSGRRRAKSSRYATFVPTLAEAKSILSRRLESRTEYLEQIETGLERCKRMLDEKNSS